MNRSGLHILDWPNNESYDLEFLGEEFESFSGDGEDFVLVTQYYRKVNKKELPFGSNLKVPDELKKVKL